MGHGNWQDESRLERLAYRAGVTPEEVREWLRDRIGADPRTQTTEHVEVDELAWAATHPPEIRAAVEAFLSQF